METIATELLCGFDRESRELVRSRAEIAAWLALILVPVFGVTDYFLYPTHFAALMSLRMASVGCSAAILVLLRTSMGSRYPAYLTMLLAAEVGMAVCGMPVYYTGFQTPHYVTLSLLILSLAILIPWSPRQCAALSGALASMYVVAALLHGPISDVQAFVTQVSAVIAAGLIAVISLSVAERLRRSEFMSRAALQRALQEKSRLVDDLREKTVKLEALNLDMEDLLYVASHDLRAPLINVQGFAREVQLGLADLRDQGIANPEAKVIYDDIEESLRFILSAISRMDSLIGSLLNVSRIATRTNPSEQVALSPMLEKIVESFRYQLDQKRIELRVGGLPAVTGDAVRLNQVFSNLIDNAIKFMGESRRRSIEIGIRNGHANGNGDRRGGERSTANGAGSPIFFVRDSGPGIPAESQDTVFRLFRRLGSTVPGEGLGLTMVRKIVEKHGGRIWIESSPGDGASFCFTLRSGGDAPAEERHDE